jgi:hypothetical protein
MRLAATCGALTLSITTLAEAQPASESLEVNGYGSCPDPGAVRAAIFQLTSPRSRETIPPGSRVSVNDQGESFRVSVTTEGSNAERTYSDPARSCERRARFAAVFAIVTLMPPDLGPEADPHREETPPPPEPARPPVAPAAPVARKPVAAPFTPPWLRLELAAVAEQALNGKLERVVRGLGGELTALPGRERLAPMLSFAFSPKRDLLFAGTRASLTRTQGVLGLRYTEAFEPFAWGGELGLVFALSSVRGMELVHPASGTSLDLGLRARVIATLAKARVTPVLALESALFPRAAEIRAEPQGALGRLPTFWFGIAFGVGVGL